MCRLVQRKKNQNKKTKVKITKTEILHEIQGGERKNSHFSGISQTQKAFQFLLLKNTSHFYEGAPSGVNSSYTLSLALCYSNHELLMFFLV